MYTTVLINKIEADDQSEDRAHVFFMLGDMKNLETEVMDLIDESDLTDHASTILKYNGVDLYIRIKDIPYFVKAFTDKGIKIYNIYEEYEPR